jgi:hypothetical protein
MPTEGPGRGVRGEGRCSLRFGAAAGSVNLIVDVNGYFK